MTKDEAVELIKGHSKDLSMLVMLMSLSGLAFGTQGEEIEAALGLPPATLAKALNETKWMDGFSAYQAVLQNAIDGQLASSVETVWGGHSRWLNQ